MRALIERPSEYDAPNRNADGYIKKLPVDPWGNSYGYVSDGQTIDIFTLGADAKAGGEGQSADIHWAEL